MKHLKFILCLSWTGLLVIPLALTIYPAGSTSLGGLEEPPPPARFSWTDWFAGAFSPAFEARFQRLFGCRAWLIRSANQLNYSLFGIISAKDGGQPILRGGRHWLFRQDYENLAASSPVKFKKKELIRDLKQAVSALERRRLSFLLVLAPNKSFICGNREAAWRPRFLADLAEAGIPVVDGNAILKTEYRRQPLVFPPAGIHWSYYGSWIVWERGVAPAAVLKGMALPSQTVDRVAWLPPQGLDHDLGDLMNLWREDPEWSRVMPYPVVTEPPPSGHALSALVLGDSFSFGLLDAMARSGGFGRLTLLYYGTSCYDYARTRFDSSLAPILIPDEDVRKGPWPKWRHERGLPIRKKPFGAGGGGWGPLLADREMVLLVVAEINLNEEWLRSMLSDLAQYGEGALKEGHVENSL